MISLPQIISLHHHQMHREEEQNPVNMSGTTANNSMDSKDFISRLPTDILHQIIYLLPFESAVRTTVLSTHWKDLWKELLLDQIHDVTTEAANAAISINGALQLDFSACKQEFPRPFAQSFLTWKLWEDHPLDPQEPSFTAKNVRHLYLISVKYPFYEAISSLLSSLPLLQSLTIANCNGVRFLHLKLARGLDKLCVLDCPQLQSLRFKGLYLESLRYRGRLVSFKLEVSRLHLKDAMLYFREGLPIRNTINFDSNTINFDGLKSILESIKGVKYLTLCRWIFEGLMSDMLQSLGSNHKYHLDKLTELWWIDCSMERANFIALLRFLKLCPRLKRLYVTIDPECYDMGSSEEKATKVPGQTNLCHLKMLKLEGFADKNKEISFEKGLRHLFGKRPLILAKSKGTCTLRCLVYDPDLEEQGKYPYKFKKVKNLPEKYSDHVHMKL